MNQDAETRAYINRRNFQTTPWKHDARSRRFSHHRFFGTTTALPAALERDPGPLTDQGPTLRCTGYGNAAEGFFIHGIPMNPDWQAAKVGQKQGQSVDEAGGDPNACMKSMRDDGFLPLSASNQVWQTHSIQGSGWHSYNDNLDTIARQYDTAIAFFKVDGPYDIFTNIKSAIFKACDLTTGCGQGVDAFGPWYQEWTTAPHGVIPDEYRTLLGYHRWVFFGWKRIGDKEYLACKNSYGDQGDNGVYWFPASVVNREFAKWGTTLKILKTLPQEDIDAAKDPGPIGRLWDAVINAWYRLSELYGDYAH